MIYEEFNYYWNDLFSKQILEHSFVLSLPDFVKPSVSVWLLNWKEYIEEKYNSQYFSDKFTVREMKVQQFQDEINKVKTFFLLIQKLIFLRIFESLESGLNLSFLIIIILNTMIKLIRTLFLNLLLLLYF